MLSWAEWKLLVVRNVVTDVDEMKNQFYTISEGGYAKLLVCYSEKIRVQK